MFEILTRILLWLLIIAILWYIFSQFIPRVYLTWLGGVILFAFMLMAFLDPTSRAVSSVWGIFSLPLKPLGLAIFLLITSFKEGTKKVATNQVVAALLILLVSSMPIVAYWLTNQAEINLAPRPSVQTAQQQIPAEAVRAIVVINEGANPVDPSFRSRTQVSTAQDGFNNVLASRLLYAGRLYDEYANFSNPLVIVGAGPGINLSTQVDGTSVQDSIRTVLGNAGVPGDRIIIETQGTDLYSSAIAIIRDLELQGFRPDQDVVLLITPSLNMSRSISTFASQGIRALPRPTDRFAFQVEGGGRLLARVSDLLPNVDALALTTRVVDEYLTSVYYFLRGWLAPPMI